MMEPCFKDIWDDLPDWHDIGKRVEAIRADGSRVTGRLLAIDMTPGPSENPILGIEVGDEELSWDDFEQWRYA